MENLIKIFSKLWYVIMNISKEILAKNIRKHSNWMRTARLLTVVWCVLGCPGCVCRGGCKPTHPHGPRGRHPPDPEADAPPPTPNLETDTHPPHPWTEGMTQASENITFPQLVLRATIIFLVLSFVIVCVRITCSSHNVHNSDRT